MHPAVMLSFSFIPDFLHILSLLSHYFSSCSISFIPSFPSTLPIIFPLILSFLYLISSLILITISLFSFIFFLSLLLLHGLSPCCFPFTSLPPLFSSPCYYLIFFPSFLLYHDFHPCLTSLYIHYLTSSSLRLSSLVS